MWGKKTPFTVFFNPLTVNQLTGFCMMGTLVAKGLSNTVSKISFQRQRWRH